MAGKSSTKRMTHSDSDDNDELFLPPSSTLSFHHAHLQRSEVNNSVTAFRSFSSDMEDDCFHQIQQDCQNAASQSGVINEKPTLTRQESIMSQSSENEAISNQARLMRQGSIVDGLLHEIYDHWHSGRRDSFDSDTLTECSSTSEFMWWSRHDFGMYSLDGGYQSSVERRQTGCYTRSFLQSQDVSQLSRLLSSIQRLTTVMSARLVRQLKRRDRRLAKRNRNYDVVTAILQAASLKRQIDTRMRFSIAPPQGQPSAFDQWKDAMRAVCRLPMGIPTEFRKKVWLSLADHYLVQLRINWDKTLRFVFNERSNPDDDKLGMQIVKDLHRTGCSNFSGDDNVEDRAILKRVLLAYARWNKRVGYCQGFNVIAALLLNVMDRKEDDALKVMIYLIDSVLPESYFANNLRALSVDMAVFRDLLALTYPRLSKHLDRLQLQAQDVRTGACYEPPLTNVFTMQWFLTLFATCLPVTVVLRVWDSVLLEGSEILLRTALTIWGKLSKRILGVSSADEFYSVMGELSTSIMEGSVMDGDSIIKSIYSLGDFPFPHLNELREKYTYNIRPLTPSTSSGVRKVGGRSLIKAMLYSDDDDMDDDDVTAMACMPGEMSSSSSDISVLGPGVYGSGLDPSGGGSGRGGGDMQMERMSTDINSLKLQYQRLKERQQQAHIIIAAASQKKAQLVSSSSSSSKKPISSSSRPRGIAPSLPSSILLPSIESPTAMNHLFVGKHKPPSASAKNRLVTQGPRISQHAPFQHNTSSILSKQLQAVANAQAVSKSQRMRSSRSNNNKQGDQSPREIDTKNVLISHRAVSSPNDADTSTPSIPQSINSQTISKSICTETGSSRSSNESSINSSPLVKGSMENGRDKDDQDKISDDKGVQNTVCHSQDTHLTHDLSNLSEVKEHTSIPVVTLENVSDSGSSNTVVSTDVAESTTSWGSISGTTNAAVPGSPDTSKDLDNDSISDKCVQTSFESWDQFNNVIDQEDCCMNISRGGGTTVPTMPCQVSETSNTPGDNDDTMTDVCVSTTYLHNTVPYTQDNEEDNACIDSSSSLKNPHSGGYDVDTNTDSVNQDSDPPQPFVHLPSTNPHTNTIPPSSAVNPPQDNPPQDNPPLPPLSTTCTTRLHPGDNPTEDSGIDSSSTASPSTTPKRGPKNSHRSDSVDDGIEIHASQDTNPLCNNNTGKKDTVLFVTTRTTTTTSLFNPVPISETGDSDSYQGDGIATLTISSNSETDIDGNHDNKVINSCVTSEKGNGESSLDETKLDERIPSQALVRESLSTETTEGLYNDNESIMINISDVDPSHQAAQSHHSKDFLSPVDSSSPTTPSLTTITTTTTSPQRKFFRRSVSCTVSSPGLIETVPVPENLTGSDTCPTHVHQQHTKHQKQHTTQTVTNTHDSSPSDSKRKNTGQSSVSKDTKSKHANPTPSAKSGDVPPVYSRRLSIPASCHMTNDSSSTKKPFNPFPVKLFNANRAKTGLKLGLYSATTLEQLKGIKTRTTST